MIVYSQLKTELSFETTIVELSYRLSIRFFRVSGVFNHVLDRDLKIWTH